MAHDANSPYNAATHEGQSADDAIAHTAVIAAAVAQSAAAMQAALSGFTRMVPVSWIGTPSPAAYPIISSSHPTITGAYYFEWNRTTDNRLLDENGLAYLSENGTILELN